MMSTLQEIAQFLKSNDDYIIVAHENPDPDSLGSMLGLYLGLTQLGKSCRMISADPVPKSLTWSGLELIEHITNGIDGKNSCIIVLDCEPKRTGSIAPEVLQARCLINLDHHQRERGIGQIVYVDPNEAATGIIIYRLLDELGVELNLKIATPLYGAIVGDTGGFRHSNTTSEVFKITSKLMEYGIQPANIAREIFSSHTLSYLKLLGYSLSKLETSLEGKLVWLSLSHEEFLQFDIAPEEADHLISYVRMLNTAEVAMVFRETKPGEVRLGIRANKINIQKLALYFGGGGHKLASGARFEGDLKVVTEKVVRTTENYLVTGEINERNS